MTASVVALPVQAPPPVLWAELFGAVMRMKEPLVFFEGCGLAEDDCPDSRLRLAWTLCRRLALGRIPVDAPTLFSAGKRARLFSDADFAWLLGLQSASTLNETSARRVAEDLRRGARGVQLALRMETVAREIRSGGINPARVQGQLEAMGQTLARDYAPDETAESDLHEVNNRWEEVERNPASARGILLASGIKVLDELIEGFPPLLSIIAADPGVGKTAVLGSFMRAMLRRNPDLKLGLFGLEDGSEWWTRRLLADGLNMPLRHIGRKTRTDEQRERMYALNEELAPLLKRVKVYRHDTISTDEMVRRGTSWFWNDDVGAILIDNLTEVEHSGRQGGGFQEQQRNLRVENTVVRLRNLAIRAQRPVILLCHTTRPEGQRARSGPPAPHECAESSRVEKAARLMLGLWKKGEQLRATVTKATEGKSGDTCEFERIVQAALVDELGGRVVNVQEERRKEIEEKQAEKDHQAVAGSLHRKSIKDKMAPKPEKPKPEEKPKQEEQAALPLGEEKKPDGEQKPEPS